MKTGYARASTKDQSLSMQIDALQKAGCDVIHEEIASGAKTARPVLEEIIRNIREDDIMVIWKLDRLGRNLAHLVHLTNKLIEKKVGLISLNDPIDTSTAQVRMIFGIFATLAEFVSTQYVHAFIFRAIYDSILFIMIFNITIIGSYRKPLL